MGLSSWFTHRRARKLDEKTVALIAEIDKGEKALKAATESLSAIDRKRYEIEKFCQEFQQQAGLHFSVVQPRGVFSAGWQALLRGLRRNALTAVQVEALSQLSSCVQIFLARLEASRIN